MTVVMISRRAALLGAGAMVAWAASPARALMRQDDGAPALPAAVDALVGRMTVEEKAGMVAQRRDPAVGCLSLEFWRIGGGTGVARPQRLQTHIIFEEISPAIAIHEIHDSCLSLAAKPGRKDEELVEKVYRYAAQNRHRQAFVEKSVIATGFRW